MRRALPIFALLLGGCQQNAAVNACETFIKERLRSPSTYKKVSDDGLGPAFKHDGRNVKMVMIEYDAANAYGTPIRGSQQCVFEVDESGSFIDDVEHAATMASIGADSEYAPCCLMDEKDRLPKDPEQAAKAAEEAADAALKAADEASDAAKKAVGEMK